MSEPRRDPRIPYSGVVFISWQTFDGHRNHVLGRAVALSEREIGIELATGTSCRLLRQSQGG